MCDVDRNVLEERAANVEQLISEKEKAGLKVAIKKPEIYGDYRKLLEDKEIDAVIIGTPDHWHTLIAIDAMDAGKHVYVEKPLANTIHENMLVEKAASKYNKIVQVGQWQRSDKHWQDAIEYVHSGVLGRIRLVKGLYELVSCETTGGWSSSGWGRLMIFGWDRLKSDRSIPIVFISIFDGFETTPVD